MAAAYAATASLSHTIRQIHHHPSPPIAVDSKQLHSLTENVTSLQEFLETYHSTAADADEPDPLETKIADAAHAAEDAIESHIVNRIPAHVHENRRDEIGFFNCFRGSKEPQINGGKIDSSDLYGDLEKVINDMALIKERVMEIEKEKEKEKETAVVNGQLHRGEVPASSNSDSSRSSLSMVGFEDVMLELMDKLTAEGRRHRQVIPIVGMGGIGKTTLLTNIYAHPLVKDHFVICAWATISQQYNTKEILCQLLSQANGEGIEQFSRMREIELGLALYQHLSHRKYLIVLDDLWSIEAWEKIQHLFPENENGSRILVTTRLSNLGFQLDSDYGIDMKFLDEVSSWNMFSKIVFGGKSCPLELENIGKEIVESCHGLPLSIVVIGGLLEKSERTLECWKSIRKNLNSLVNSENDEHCLKILKLSYNHLPVYLKPCFLYMGVFEEDRAIRVSTVIKLWISEGFLKPSDKSSEIAAKEYLNDLIDRNLIQVGKLGSTGSVKYCKIHDLLRDLCLREAQRERFYHVIQEHSPRGMEGQCRIVISRSTSKKKVLGDALESMRHARSYINNNVIVRRLPNSKLLRILHTYDTDKHTRHKYFLGNIFRLVNLRYLAVKVQGQSQVPSSINLLWNLHTLVVSHPRKIRAPVEIWGMPQLQYVQFSLRGLCLPDPPADNIVVMENLQTLTGVRDFKCNEQVVRRLPNIKKLGILYYKDKATQSHDVNYCLHNIERLQKLESLSCEYNQKFDCFQKLTFPHSLKSLSLHMKRDFEWESMLGKIGSLPLLRKLKLKNGYFKTGSWEVVEGHFPSLKFLSLKWCFNLENWVTESSFFPCLEHLHLIGLTDLNEIPAEIGEIPTLQSVVLEYCSEFAVRSAKRMVDEQVESQGDQVAFKVVVKLWEENEALQSLANTNFEVTVDKLIPLFIYLCFRLFFSRSSCS